MWALKLGSKLPLPHPPSSSISWKNGWAQPHFHFNYSKILAGRGKGFDYLLIRRGFIRIPPPPKDSFDKGNRQLRIKSTLYYLSALGVVVLGGSYAAVPLYRIFCAVS